MNFKEAAATLRQDGAVRFPALSTGQMRDLREHLDLTQVWNAHVKAKATEPPTSVADAISARRWPAFSHDMADVVATPHLIETALSTFTLATEYFHPDPPRLYSMNAFWTQPTGGPVYTDTHRWHRDGDDRKQLVMFVYGTDILKPEDGAHHYFRGSHLIHDPAWDAQWAAQEFSAAPADKVEVFTGPAGTTFLVDTWGMHLGRPPLTGPRLLLWARWGVSEMPESYKWDKLSPVPRAVLGSRYPDDPALQDAIKLVVV